MKKLNQSGMAHAAIVFVLLLVAVSGTGYYVYHANHKNKTVNSTETTNTENENLPEKLPTDLLTVDKVKELATTQKPDLTIVTVELDKEHGVLVYKVKLSDGSHLFFNAQTGDVVTNVEADDESDDGDLPDKSKVVITFDQARAAAIASKSDCTIDKIKLDGEDGKPVYKVTCSDGTKIFINGVDGSVIKTRKEGDNKSNTPGADKGKSDGHSEGDAKSGSKGDGGGSNDNSSDDSKDSGDKSGSGKDGGSSDDGGGSGDSGSQSGNSGDN